MMHITSYMFNEWFQDPAGNMLRLDKYLWQWTLWFSHNQAALILLMPTNPTPSSQIPMGYNSLFLVLRAKFRNGPMVFDEMLIELLDKGTFIGLDKQNFSAYNCKYFLIHQF